MNKCKNQEASNSRGHKGYRCYTNGLITILIKPGDDIPDGFVRGRKPTKWNPWSKGLTKETNEKVKQRDLKRMESREYKPLSNEHKEKISSSLKGLEPWNKGLTKEEDVRVLQASKNISTGLKLHHRKSYENDPLFYEKQKKKLNETMHKNNSFAKSKVEDYFYKELCNEYGESDIIRQYSDERYPWKCDFYVKSKDLFIEINGHWTHNKHPFDINNEEDQKELQLWEQRSLTSKFYKTAIYVWTKNDPEKLQTFRDNKLNFKIIYKDLTITK